MRGGSGQLDLGGPGIEAVARMMRDAGAERLYLKYLAPNDNRKNQPYFGGSFEVLNILPLGAELAVERPDSRKETVDDRSWRIKAPLDFSWLDKSGAAYRAPGAKLILYPQYPEVRFSGFLRGAQWAPTELMDEKRRGREEGRVLFLGVTRQGQILGYLAAPEGEAARQARDMALPATVAVFAALDLECLVGERDGRTRLFEELARIHRLDWITGKSLSSDGSLRPCNAPQCGGYTLEAELGVPRNGYSEPDFLGWEVKQHDVRRLDRPESRAVTLMTPNPDLGEYRSLKLADLVRRYGYPDRRGRSDRLNIGGVYRIGEPQPLTGLTLGLRGFDPSRPERFAANGAVVLEAPDGTLVAGWSYAKLLQLWNRKHDLAVYVPSECIRNGGRRYRYGRRVHLGEGTDFTRLLRAVADRTLYYDPGIKLETPADGKPKTHSRSQFRMKSADLGALYHRWSEQDVLEGG